MAPEKSPSTHLPKNQLPKKQFNVYLSVDVIRALKHHAVDTEQSLSGIVDTAISEYLARVTGAKGKRNRGN